MLPLWRDAVFGEEVAQLFRAKIREHFVSDDERGGEALAGEPDHQGVSLAARFHVDFLILVAFGIQPGLGANAPRTPGFDVKLKGIGHG